MAGVLKDCDEQMMIVSFGVCSSAFSFSFHSRSRSCDARGSLLPLVDPSFRTKHSCVIFPESMFSRSPLLLRTVSLAGTWTSSRPGRAKGLFLYCTRGFLPSFLLNTAAYFEQTHGFLSHRRLGYRFLHNSFAMLDG